MDAHLYRAFISAAIVVMVSSCLVYFLYPTYVIRPQVEGRDHFVSVKYKDWAGNISEEYRDYISIDRTPPATDLAHVMTPGRGPARSTAATTPRLRRGGPGTEGAACNPPSFEA